MSGSVQNETCIKKCESKYSDHNHINIGIECGCVVKDGSIKGNGNYVDYSVPLPILKEYFSTTENSMLTNKYCDVEFVLWLRSYDYEKGRCKTLFMDGGNNWTYFWRRDDDYSHACSYTSDNYISNQVNLLMAHHSIPDGDLPESLQKIVHNIKLSNGGKSVTNKRVRIAVDGARKQTYSALSNYYN